MAGKNAMLVHLKDIGRTVANPTEDVRGRTMYSTDGDELGTVEALLVDVDEQKVRLLRVKQGGVLGIGATPSFIPVDAVAEVKEKQVVVDLTRERLEGAPRYDPDLADQRPFYQSLYEYFGYAPFWGPDYVYPDFTFGATPEPAKTQDNVESDRSQR